MRTERSLEIQRAHNEREAVRKKAQFDALREWRGSVGSWDLKQSSSCNIGRCDLCSLADGPCTCKHHEERP